jgi:uncharacterized membrane protein YkoI
MKGKMLKSLGLCLIAVLMLTGIVLADGKKHEHDEHEEKVAIEQVPQAVKNIIMAFSANGKILEIEKEKEDGRIVFEAEILIGGKKIEIEMDAEGNVLEVEVKRAKGRKKSKSWKHKKMKDLSLKKAPEAVRKTIMEFAKGGKIKEIEKEKENGIIVYEAEIIKDGKEIEIKVDMDGNILEVEKEISIDEAPEKVANTIKDYADGGKIKEIEMEEKNGITVYEAEIIKDGKEIEIKVDSDGKILKEEVEDDDDHDDDDDDDDDHDDDDDDDDDDDHDDDDDDDDDHDHDDDD